jgi:Flp pilus assembly protein TadG
MRVELIRSGARAHQHAQAMVEFAMVIGVFLLALLGAVSAGLYTIERSAAVTAVAAGARAAASAQPGNPNQPDLQAGRDVTQRIAQQSMLGTRVFTAGSCPASGAGMTSGSVVACSFVSSPGMVTVAIVGKPVNPVPITFGFNWTLDITATAHEVTFQP